MSSALNSPHLQAGPTAPAAVSPPPPAPPPAGDFWGNAARAKGVLVLVYLTVTLLPVLVLGFFIHSLMFTVLRARSLDTLIAKGQYAGAILQHQIDDSTVMLTLFAQRPEVLKALREGNAEAVRAELDNLLTVSGSFSRALIADTDGSVRFTNSKAEAQLKAACKGQDWFRGAVHDGKPYLAEAGESAVKGERFPFALACPIKDADQLVGVLALFPATDFLARRLGAVSTEQEVECYVVDRRGTLVWHSAKPVTTTIELASRPEVRELLAGRQGVYEGKDPDSGVAKVSMHIPLRQTLGVVLSTPKNAVYKGLDQMAFIFLVMVITLSVLAAVSALLAATVLAETQRKSVEVTAQNRTLEKEMAERRRVEDALQRSREEFRTLVQNTSDWFWEIDATGAFVYTSPRIADLLVYWPEDVVGKKLVELLAPEEQEQFTEVLGHFVQQAVPFSALEMVFLHKDRSRLILVSSGAPVLNEFGKVSGFRGITRRPQKG